VTHVAVDTAVGAVLEETLALSGTRTISCLANSDSAKDSEESGDELHVDRGVGWSWVGVGMLEFCGLMFVNVFTIPFI
jgi:hypothetical protein